MPLHENVRKELLKAVTRVRTILTEDFTLQCKTIYGIQPDGAFIDLAQLGHLSEEEKSRATVLRDRVEHLAAGAESGESLADVVDRMLREQAFTVLNRLCALRMCEERDLVQECVRKRVESKGFRLFEENAAHLGGGTYSRYQLYLSLLCDELSLELGMLFDRFAATAVLFPSETALGHVMEELNRPSLHQLWADDETIGWIYQYFNPAEERKKMRQESAAPQNSRELAVRNQFFTPRYVVEFLTENTLGLIWYEMRKADTGLTSVCRYLLRKPNEVFLSEGERAPVQNGTEASSTLEDPLQQTVYREHRPKKDPRELRVIDPACGSGHFLLYAFDLLAVIYEEAWSDPASPPFNQTGRALREEPGLSTLEHLRRAVPKLIIEHNLHGVDIDPRAVQIAALALRLRAQRAWKTIGVKATDRPRIDKSNFVTAAPMPGEADMRRDFTSGLRPKVVGQLVDVVFDKLALAGEAGSLLRIETDLNNAIADARAQWISGPKPEQAELFPELVKTKPEQQQFQFDVTDVTDLEFWEQAERRVLIELQKYAVQSEGGQATRRRFFASDAIHGFEFVDLCHKTYDVVLMNPPFGSFSKRWASQARLVYPNSSNDILAAFVERFLALLNPGGRLGAITSRTCFFLSSFKDWRLNVLLQEAGVECIADLGQGVMDSAMVEAAAYVLQRGKTAATTTVFRAIADADRRGALEAALDAYNQGETEPRLFCADSTAFRLLPDSPFTYWIDKEVLQHFVAEKHFEPDIGVARNGMTTGDDFRWVRAMWEVPYEETIFCYYPIDGNATCEFSDPIVQAYQCRRSAGRPTWGFFVKAGASQPWYSPLTLKINWASDGVELRNFRDANGKPRAFLRSRELYYRSGFSWTRRAVRFYPYTIPSGCIPSVSRYMAFPDRGMSAQAVGICGSRLVSSFLRFYAEFWQRPNFLVDTVKMLPWPEVSDEDNACFEALVDREVDRRRRAYQNHEPFHEFLMPVKVRDFSDGGRALAFDPAALLDEDTERLVARSFGVSDEQARRIDRDLLEAIAYQRGMGPDVEAADSEGDSEPEEESDADFVLDYSDGAIEEAHLSYLLGCGYGRWDIRIARNPDLAPKLPHPFAPLPVCPPGTLVGPEGLPAESGRIVSEEWLSARPDAGTLPPVGSVAQPTITDQEYPIPINWNGILVDDPGLEDGQSHVDDIVRRMRLALEVIWKDRAAEVEQHAGRILKSSLRDYIRKPSGLFQDHLGRYSKSRRKAPIYWPLSTESGKYTLWIYYPRLTDQTLFSCVNDYIDPKLRDIQRDLGRLNDAGSADRKSRQQLDDLVDLQAELKVLRTKLLDIIQLPYRPNQDDGVLINAAPLWPLFRHKPWQTELRKCWEALKSGKYDWSHMAYNIWPDRVRESCRKDQSIAIAHGQEDLYEYKETKKVRGRKK
ncbi:hypothetical protein F183_A12470 [Bryobacterales bacterium F-183]|nr:hypothetical protein F183_A12470 [Bryobacterales bacterium F-183]